MPDNTLENLCNQLAKAAQTASRGGSINFADQFDACGAMFDEAAKLLEIGHPDIALLYGAAARKARYYAELIREGRR